VALIDSQRYDEAIKMFDKIIEINPHKIEAFTNKCLLSGLVLCVFSIKAKEKNKNYGSLFFNF
jgi:tetratricopeptide (TPR) repeat protein